MLVTVCKITMRSSHERMYGIESKVMCSSSPPLLVRHLLPFASIKQYQDSTCCVRPEQRATVNGETAGAFRFLVHRAERRKLLQSTCS